MQSTKEQVALGSIAASALLTLAKFAAGLISGSLALLSEAGHNLVDVGMTVITYYAVRVAGKPADEEHNYGHGKVESLAALIETGLLFALSGFILVEATKRLWRGHVEIDANIWTFGVLVVSIIVDFSRSHVLSRVAKETKSDALAADVLHFASDIIGSAIVLLGLVAARFGYPQGDAVAAFAVALYIAVAGYRLGRNTVDKLIDAAPKGMAASLRDIAGNVPGVIAVDSLRLRPVGANVLGDIGISVPRTLPQEEVTEIKHDVSAAIAAAHPDVALTVETTPVALNDETILERVLLIGARRHTPIHHVIVQRIEGRTSVSFDIEVDGRMPLGQAHSIASALEAAVRNELGPEIEVETHIEPLEPRELPGHDAPEQTRDAVAKGLADLAKAAGVIDVHNIRVRETPAGLVVNYHCRVDPKLSVDEAHIAVDGLERKIQADFPKIARIIGHAEPLR